MCRNVKAARRCEACCSGLEICHEHMVLCRKEAHIIACNYYLLPVLRSCGTGCCEDVETRRKQIRLSSEGCSSGFDISTKLSLCGQAGELSASSASRFFLAISHGLMQCYG